MLSERDNKFRVEVRSDAEREQINVLTPAERREALLRAAADKLARLSGQEGRTETEMECPYCNNTIDFSRRTRNSREFAQTQVVCNRCGASKITLSAHNPYAPEQEPFDADRNRAGRVVGEWQR